MIDVPYAEQAERKQQLVEELIGDFGRVDPIIRMKNPDHYRNKVTSISPLIKRAGRSAASTKRAPTRWFL